MAGDRAPCWPSPCRRATKRRMSAGCRIRAGAPRRGAARPAGRRGRRSASAARPGAGWRASPARPACARAARPAPRRTAAGPWIQPARRQRRGGEVGDAAQVERAHAGVEALGLGAAERERNRSVAADSQRINASERMCGAASPTSSSSRCSRAPRTMGGAGSRPGGAPLRRRRRPRCTTRPDLPTASEADVRHGEVVAQAVGQAWRTAATDPPAAMRPTGGAPWC